VFTRAIGVVFLCACGHGSTSLTIDASDPGHDAHVDPEIGCADGVRDGFADVATFPLIAACSGAWVIPGLGAPANTDPKCATSGDDRPTNGVGCAAANLCAADWHICASDADVAAHLPAGQTCAAITTNDFFATNQGSEAGGVCSTAGANDLFGCGQLGNAASPTCAPLDAASGNQCAAIESAGWSCGGTPGNTTERTSVVKPMLSGGGVLCCKT
jgi:hypothetical protein